MKLSDWNADATDVQKGSELGGSGQIMSSRSRQQKSNASAPARSRARRGSRRLTIRSRRLGAIACLVALCGVIFGVGGALGQPDAARPAQAARVVRVAHVRGHATASHRAAHPRRLRTAVRSVRAHRAHRAHAAHKRAGRRHIRRMVARAKRAHARRAAHAARARQQAAKRRHRHHKAKTKNGHRLTMRSFVARLTPATTAVGGESLPGSLIDIARPGSGALTTASPAATSAAPASSTSGSPQVNALANQVRAVATGATAPARASGSSVARTPAHTQTKHKPAPARSHKGSSGTTFLLPLGVPAPLEHFVNRVPEPLWIALASALAMAGIGGAAALRSGRRARRQAGEYAAVAAVALTDPLTGVLNRRGFGDVADRELARARRYRTPFVLAYVDVRGLKAVNDSEGHLAGDAVIKQVARLLSDSVRAEDAAGRLGGDELALLLTGQSATGADAVIERIQSRIPACRAELGLGTEWGVTIGTASFPADGATFEELVATADRRLYEQRGIQLR